MKMNVLTVSTADIAGGAEKNARALSEGYATRGHQSWLAVGLKRSRASQVLQIPSKRSLLWIRTWLGLRSRLRRSLWSKHVVRPDLGFLKSFAEPGRWVRQQLGHEDFRFPASRSLLDLSPELPDIVHCHNLHGAWLPDGGYFDLRILPSLSHRMPVVLTLHDAWLLSGHCAHSFECERWKTGCGHCPDLSIYPAVRRDATAYNWSRKRAIYEASSLYISTPSQWLMDKVEQSMLAPAVAEARVIPYGVNMSVFRPGDKQAAREALGLPRDAGVLLFASKGIRHNIWKDYQTLRASIAQLAEGQSDKTLSFVALGEEGPEDQIGGASVSFIPFQENPGTVAQYYQAADVYVHAARADTFPNAILEALACGTPVVATAVGGIPEQVRSLEHVSAGTGVSTVGVSEATGLLVEPGDSTGLARSIGYLLSDDNLRRSLGENAHSDAQRRFHSDLEIDAYLDWYHSMLDNG